VSTYNLIGATIVAVLIWAGSCLEPAHAQDFPIGNVPTAGVWADGSEQPCPNVDTFGQELTISAQFFEDEDGEDPMIAWAPRFLKLPAACLVLAPGVWMPIADYKKLRADRVDLQVRVTDRASKISEEAEGRIESAEMWGWIFSAVGIVAGLAVGMCGDGDCTEF